MAGPTRITLKANTTAGVVPSAAQLAAGELVINTGDGKLYTELANGAVVQIAQPISSGNTVGVVLGIEYTSSNTDAQILDSFAIATYRSGEYFVSVKDNTNNDYHVGKLIVLHDGTNAYNEEYGVAFSNQSLMTVSCNIASGNFRLWVTPTIANTTFKMVRSLVVV